MTGPFIDTDRIASRNRDRSTVACSNGIVCASQPLAAMAGVDILKSGGNCIDAAIATNAMLGLTEPHMNGVGGDLFAILWSERDQKLFGLNASGRSPAAWNLDEAANRNLTQIPWHSALAWTVPGCVSGWAALSERFGKRTLAECLEPAIDYASNGFPLSPMVARAFDWTGIEPEFEATLATVYRPDGKTPKFGDTFRNPALAQTYRQIAEGGQDAFYNGGIAEQIVATSREFGGLMAREDLAGHRFDWVDPVNTGYRGYDVWELPPNGQGIAALQMLNLLEHFDIESFEPNSAEHLHLFIEAKKLAYEDRARHYADPEFADVPVDWLISKAYAAERVALIDPKKASERLRPGDPPLGSDTVYLTAADGEGNMISFIQSIYAGWGSAICPQGLGFAMQNRGHSFALDPSHPNRLEPGKRPFHTIIPGFVTHNGRPLLSFGVMGGDFQPQGHCQVLMNMLDFQMSPQQAGDQPRVEHIGSPEPTGAPGDMPGTVSFEAGVDAGVIRQLIEMGHRKSESAMPKGGYQAIWRTDDPLAYFGGSDPRRDGAAIGY